MMNAKQDMNDVFELLIDKAGKKSADNTGHSYPPPEPHNFSKDHQMKMKKLFQKEKIKLIMKNAGKYSKRVAVFILAMVIISGVTIFSVQAWRIRFLNFILEVTQTSTDIRFGDDSTEEGTFSNESVTLSYIPEGFELGQNQTRKSGVNLSFIKDELNFSLFITTVDSDILSIDTEDAVVKDFELDGKKAILSLKDNNHILVWHDDEKAYLLSGNISEDELIKIAKNVKK